MTHIMLDLETFGTTPGCAVRSIGACTFNLGGDDPGTGVEFYANIDTHSCLYARLHIEKGTHEWWQQQSPEARDRLKENAQSLAAVVSNFEAWCWKLGPTADLRIWSQGANFDPVIWEAAARAVGRKVPWKFYNCRDTRTLYELAGLDARSVVREGTYHSALDDARHQARCCREAWKLLRGPT